MLNALAAFGVLFALQIRLWLGELTNQVPESLLQWRSNPQFASKCSARRLVNACNDTAMRVMKLSLLIRQLKLQFKEQ